MNNRKPTLRDEILLVPGWAYFLALGVFVCFQLLLFLAWKREPHAPPIALQLFVRLVPGTILAFLPLLIGYVNRDAKRRGMNRALWTFLVIFIPNAIGFILYFLLRQPIAMPCPQCGTLANPSFNFCPKCKYNLRPTCPGCQHAVSAEDRFCPHCSRELIEQRATLSS